MQSHHDFILKIINAVQEGADFTQILDNEREHLLACEQCRQAAFALLGDAIGEDELLLLLVEQAGRGGPIPEPSDYPSFDFSFLDKPAPDLWRSSPAEAGQPQELTPGSRESQPARQIHILRYVVEILLGQKGARLGELAAALQPFQLAPVPVRGEKEKRLEGLTLEDPENDVRIVMRLAGQNQLNILLSSSVATSAMPGRLVLMTSQEPRHTLQRLTFRPGEETSLPLMRGDLIIQVEHDQQTWEIPIQVL